MTYQLPEKLRNLEPYQPNTGVFHVRLDANESFISLPDDIRKEIHALEVEKRKIERILDKIFDEYEDGIYTPNEFVKRKAKHNARLEAIDREIAELEKTIPQKEEYEEKIVTLHDAIELLKDEEIPAQLKNEYLKQFVEKIEFSRENDMEFTLDIYLA